ncbi:hypothetical protein LCGC14_2208970, partial [marine sediment metagenome]
RKLPEEGIPDGRVGAVDRATVSGLAFLESRKARKSEETRPSRHAKESKVDGIDDIRAVGPHREKSEVQILLRRHRG